MTSEEHVEIAILGAGFSGLGMALALAQAGRTDFVVLEKADDVGGTWRENTYPGAACDVPSNLYSYSFAPNPDWTRAFSPQAEIQSYLQRCARDGDVLPRVRFGHEVLGARWDADHTYWRVDTNRGPFTARALVVGTGPLQEPRIPALAGLDSFAGPVFHSASWDHDVDLRGRRVAAVGTGASAIQFVPRIAPIVADLTVFQRTPPWVVPRADRAVSGRERRLYRRVPAAQRFARVVTRRALDATSIAFNRRPEMLAAAGRLARRNLERQVHDPELRARITPDYMLGCKRILFSNDWYPALCRPHVEVVPAAMVEVGSDWAVAADGSKHTVDVIIFGTGFHVTDPPAAGLVRGTDGERLADLWGRTGMQAYLGSAVSGFPNLFFLLGPNTGLGNNSMVIMIEAQVRYVLGALEHLQAHREAVLDVRPDVMEAYNRDLQHRMARTVWNTGGCASWYLDEHGRNTTLWPCSTRAFEEATRVFRPVDYE